MASIRINTVNNGPTIIGLNAGSTYELGAATDYQKTVIEEKVNGSVVATITINKYDALDAGENWDELNEAAYKCIEATPQNFNYPVYDSFSDEDYLKLDISEPLADIIAGAMGNDLPAVYSEWLSWVGDEDADQDYGSAVTAADEAATAAEQKCEEDAGQGCPDSGYYFDPLTGLQCDCNSGSGCCASLGAAVGSQLIANAVEAVGMTKKHIYLFENVTISGPS